MSRFGFNLNVSIDLSTWARPLMACGLKILSQRVHLEINFLIRFVRLDGIGSFDNISNASRRPILGADTDKVQNAIIEERIGRERPCRTLFTRNIKAGRTLSTVWPD